MIEPGSVTEDPVRRAKRELRRHILAARAALPAAERERLSVIIAERMLALSQLESARHVLGYLSFGHELQTDALLRGLMSRGASLILPRIDREAHRLRLFHVANVERDTIPGVWGIREPDPLRCSPAELEQADVIIVPGVAFTAQGERLGYGGGYYDELLSRGPRLPVLIAPAFDLQIVSALPSTPRDRCVDLVVTETGLHRR